jgi:hypothetical protein
MSITKEELDYFFDHMQEKASNYKTVRALAYTLLELENTDLLPMLVLKYPEVQEAYTKYSIKCEELKATISFNKKYQDFLSTLTDYEREVMKLRDAYGPDFK